MRIGCISLGDIKCDGCKRLIPYPERYLYLREADGAKTRLCAGCAMKRGYAGYKSQKGEPELTFFTGLG